MFYTDGVGATSKIVSGRKTYIGKPCRQCGNCVRQTASRACVECARDELRKRRAANPEHARALNRKYYYAHREDRVKYSRKYYADNRKELNAKAREYKAKNPDIVKANTRNYRAANPEKVKENVRRWRAANPEKVKAQYKNWVASNPEKARAGWAKRSARRRGAAGAYSGADVERIYKSQRGRCAYYHWCGNKLGEKYHCDHIVPLVRGGDNKSSNIQLTCPECNLRKNGADPVDFARRLGLLL